MLEEDGNGVSKHWNFIKYLSLSSLNDETNSPGTFSRTSAFVSISQYTGKCAEKYKPPQTSEEPPSYNTFL